MTGPSMPEYHPAAHPEDSLAPAEHMLPDSLQKQIDTFKALPDRPYYRLARAWLYNQYALATPDFAGDDELFRNSAADLQEIIDHSSLDIRHPIMLGARMLKEYEEVFRLRARSNLRPPLQVAYTLQRQLGGIMLEFVGDRPITEQQYGQLSELIATTYLLGGEYFPYLASFREESNIVTADNHDIYTLHPCPKNRIKKVPVSVKHRLMLSGNGIVAVLTVGRAALEVARSIPPYTEDPDYRRWQPSTKRSIDKIARATRLAADIMICHTDPDEVLSVEDTAFMWTLTAHLQDPLRKFAELETTPNYASNAEIIKAEMKRQAAARMPKTPRQTYKKLY